MTSKTPVKSEVFYSVRAMRGPTLRCKGWKQESLLRMLENNMENAEHPERLVIYGGIGKCARNWESYHAIVESLLELEDDETLAVQSGMPVAIFKTHRLAPRVVMANTNIMKATWPVFYDLQDRNLTMFSQYTAGPWEYIGTQGVIQGTFETLGAIAEQHFDGSLAGRILLTAGMGGMGGNQTRAMAMHGGVAVSIDADERVIWRRLGVGFVFRRTRRQHALRLERAAAKRPLHDDVAAALGLEHVGHDANEVHRDRVGRRWIVLEIAEPELQLFAAIGDPARHAARRDPSGHAHPFVRKRLALGEKLVDRQVVHARLLDAGVHQVRHSTD